MITRAVAQAKQQTVMIAMAILEPAVFSDAIVKEATIPQNIKKPINKSILLC